MYKRQANASALTALDAKTTVAVQAGNVTSLSGTATEVIAAYAADAATTIVLDGDEAVSVSGTVSVADANTISSKTSGVVTASIASGTYTALNALNETNNAYALSLSEQITVTQADALDAKTTGVITATLSTQDLATLAGLNGTGNAYTITISDTSATAAALTTLDGKITVAVQAGNVTTLSGTATEVKACLLYTSPSPRD